MRCIHRIASNEHSKQQWRAGEGAGCRQWLERARSRGLCAQMQAHANRGPAMRRTCICARGPFHSPLHPPLPNAPGPLSPRRRLSHAVLEQEDKHTVHLQDTAHGCRAHEQSGVRPICDSAWAPTEIRVRSHMRTQHTQHTHSRTRVHELTPVIKPDNHILHVYSCHAWAMNGAYPQLLCVCAGGITHMVLRQRVVSCGFQISHIPQQLVGHLLHACGGGMHGLRELERFAWACVCV